MMGEMVKSFQGCRSCQKVREQSQIEQREKRKSATGAGEKRRKRC